MASSVGIVLAVVLVGWPRVTRSPRFLLRFGDYEQQCWALRTMARGRLISWDLRQVVKALDSPDMIVRLNAITVLAQTHETRFASPLRIVSITDPEVSVRGRALEGLAELGGELAWRTVLSRLNADEPELRMVAAACVTRYGRREALERLVKLAETDTSVEVRIHAQEAVRELLRWSAPREETDSLVVPGSLFFEAEHGCGYRPNFEIAPSARELAALPETARSNALFSGLDGYSGEGWIRCLEGGGGRRDWRGRVWTSLDVGRADYPLIVPESGTYRLWLRAWWMDKCGNSVNVWFDHSPTRVFRDDDRAHTGYRQWRWSKDTRTVTLTAGYHVLHVQAREDGVRLDALALLPEGESPPVGSVPANVRPAAFAPPGLEVVLSRESEIIGAANRVHLTVHVLRLGPRGQEGVLVLDPGDEAVLDCDRSLPISLGDDEWSERREVTVTFPADSARREYLFQASVAARGQAGDSEAAVVFSKPWDWRLTDPLPGRRNAMTLLTDERVAWRSFSAEELYDRYGRMDFERVFGNGAHGVVYLQTRILVDEAGEYQWLLNSDDQSTVWLDGRRLIANTASQPAEDSLVRHRTHLGHGEHTVVAEVTQSNRPDARSPTGDPNYWLFRLRLRRSDRVPALVRGVGWD